MKIMNMPTLKPGYWYKNIAVLGEKPIWVEEIMPADIDPNDVTIFGYDVRDFMKRQQRQA